MKLIICVCLVVGSAAWGQNPALDVGWPCDIRVYALDGHSSICWYGIPFVSRHPARIPLPEPEVVRLELRHPGRLVVMTGSDPTNESRTLMQCEMEAQTKPSDCRLLNGATLEEVMQVIMESQKLQHEATEQCGQWGDWILDQNGNVMYRRVNPPCPKHPPKGPKNYSICDLYAIGMQHLPEGAMPRTLDNPVDPPPYTDNELREWCGRKVTR